MNKTIKNKLLHFYTDGSIYEDFADSRAKKTAKLRRVIRLCFYVHFAAAVICIALAAVMRAGLWSIVAVSVSEFVLTMLAFLAVGDVTLMKTLLYCGDIVFAAAMFVMGALKDENKIMFFIAGAVSVVAALIALGAFFAALCKMFLESFSPLAIRREHYTLLPNFSDETPDDISDIPDMPEVPYFPDTPHIPDAPRMPETPYIHDTPHIPDTPYIPDAHNTHNAPEAPMTALTPQRSEFQELADKLKEIFHSPKAGKMSGNLKTAASPKQDAANTQSQTEVR